MVYRGRGCGYWVDTGKCVRDDVLNPAVVSDVGRELAYIREVVPLHCRKLLVVLDEREDRRVLRF